MRGGDGGGTGRMSALATSYSKRDLATVMDFMEKGVALSREYREYIRGRAG